MQAVHAMKEGVFHLGGDEDTEGVDPERGVLPGRSGRRRHRRRHPGRRHRPQRRRGGRGGPRAAGPGARPRRERGPAPWCSTSPAIWRSATFALPEIGDDDGLLRIEACGLCGTDHEQYTGALPAGFAVRARPRVRRHHRGASVRAAAERWGVTVGDRVAVEVFQSCRHLPGVRGRACTDAASATACATCTASSPSTRPRGCGAATPSTSTSPPTRMLLPVPAGARPRRGHRSSTRSAPASVGASPCPDTQPGDVVAVLGPGIRGLSACAAAKEAGAGFVLITGVGPRDAERLALRR